MWRIGFETFETTPVRARPAPPCGAYCRSEPPQACKLLPCAAALTGAMSRTANFPDSASALRNWSPALISRRCSSVRGPSTSPCRLVSTSSKSNTATLSRPARAGADIASVNAMRTNTDFMCGTGKSAAARRQIVGCNVRQFGHVSSWKPLFRRYSQGGMGGLMIRLLAGAIGLGMLATSALAADPVEIGIGYLHRGGIKPTLSLVEQPAENDGIAGARLAIEDNNTTGKFLNQHFTLEEVRLKGGEDVAKAATDLAARNGFIIADLPADALLKAADALKGRGTVLLNAGAIDDRLREQDCRANVIHVAPTRSMLADALAQYLVWKQWKRWLLVAGSHDADKLYADALRRAAARFGAKIVQERTFEDTGGARRTDSGVTLIQRQMPVFTQQAPAYDVLVAADESEDVAAYLT